MESSSHPLDAERPQNTAPVPSQYPDPEMSGLTSSVWPTSSIPYEVDSSIATPFQPHTHGIFSLKSSRAEFELASAQRRSQSRELSDKSDFLEELSENELGDISDADSEARDFAAGINKFKDDVRNFRASQISDDRDEHLGQGVTIPNQPPDNCGPAKPTVRTRGFIRGPRKAAEPSGEIKLRLSKANEAFISGRYEDARVIILEIIRINAETYEAWTILSAVFQELGRINDAVMALVYAAHLRPKDVAGWLRCAQFAQEETGEHRRNYLPTANFCYASALRADSKCVDARLGKAMIYLERNKPAGAISEYKHILKVRPHDLEIIRLLASAYIDNNELKSATELYKETFAYLRSPPDEDEQEVTWNDVNAYITLYEYLGEYDTALMEVKSVSRWLLGRESEIFWDECKDDDREWDTDSSRRAEVSGFDVGRFPLSTYGDGLPLELRVRMGLCRLSLGQIEEALVAPKLLEAGLYQDALKFYQSIKRYSSLVTPSIYIEIGRCFQGSGLGFKAEECFQMAIQMDDDNVEARMELAKMYELLGEQEQAFIFVNEVMSIKRSQNARLRPGPKPGRKQAKIAVPQTESKAPKSDVSMMPTKVPRAYKPRRLADPTEKQKEEKARAEQLQSQYYTMRKEHKGMRNGDVKAATNWMDAARDLTDDFRSFKLFYPWDKYIKFLGYTGETRAQVETPLESDLTDMAERLSRNLGAEAAEKSQTAQSDIPADYRGISFSAWLDIFLEFAMCLAREGRMREAYEMCEATKDAIVFYHSKEDMFLIHVAWCMCALFCNDEETCVTTARFFMKDYQFTTDSYRMFAAVTRMCQSPISWYSSGPTQKYILRQIKAMDYALVDDSRRKKYFAEKGSYSAVDENGRAIINNDMDIALLMLYGHILYTGTSYSYALNYFFRAHALDPENPVINLNIGLAYVHYGLKRQAENRQHLILQGMTFLFIYYESRVQSPHVEERQEAHYNIARVYHMVGLSHLAIPYYSLVLKQATSNKGNLREDLVINATYNLQSIYSMAGNPAMVDNTSLVI
ncbi:hypothetical protein OIDMADRAFT_24417 [Oidiodendron maius Zn]|uniref:Cdc23 domain-containing protein n=1 Tax=Oidiodendron maius (strain Zn) TaxID=913774 RepID=A0A0C3HST5_OIDMZ|nr:hypothetical protein OIDMADRAFT_24417 [Oidiodendron maius Zn]